MHYKHSTIMPKLLEKAEDARQRTNEPLTTLSPPPKRAALFVLPTDRMGGAERVTLLVAIAAAESGLFSQIECFVLSRRRSGTLSDFESMPHTRVHYTNARSELRGVPRLLRALKQVNYALVFSSHTHTNAVISLMRKLGLVNAERVVSRESTMIFERQLGLRGWIIRSLYRLYGSQDAIICQTNKMRESFIRNTPSGLHTKLIVRPNPLAPNVIANNEAPGQLNTPPRPFEDVTVVWCGRFVEVKRPALAVHTLNQLRTIGVPHARMIMIGDGPLHADTRLLAKQLNLYDAIDFVGYSRRPMDLMRDCSVGLLTSEAEGFPNVLLEMLASNVSHIVTTDCAGDLDTLPATTVARSESPVDLARCILSSLSIPRDEDEVSRMLAERTPNRYLLSIL